MFSQQTAAHLDLQARRLNYNDTFNPQPLCSFASKPKSTLIKVTRTEKRNDRNHTGLADGTATAEDHLPRYFAKSGHPDADPTAIKKQGGGKGNWGKPGAEMDDYGYKFANSRRRSNSSTQALGDFKTKFEAVDQDPVFEEEVHGPTRTNTEDSNTLEKEESTDTSTVAGSVEEEEGAKKI
ncbi:hypothetical protein EPUS_08517 [Endocarpon pusillum Z07020]|uniref:Hyaluronan/mRNA-binding protein domain-containing protein n=1 Tax=Endocarpon pusillum (strain Z07020 / HMAS-L-300199) TaxID=1263415 RepID=U1G8R9_ENDPU|nr:uncharacterized protein EPUS_08517 [Endocarpon pusillum Z07020]ERF68081.1 hypothetical protein EPUS_08517 [Endocarpon pusillum Z07020]